MFLLYTCLREFHPPSLFHLAKTAGGEDSWRRRAGVDAGMGKAVVRELEPNFDLILPGQNSVLKSAAACSAISGI